MTRSKRKTPICGITTASSDKSFKISWHRQLRRRLKQQLWKIFTGRVDSEDIPKPKVRYNHWASNKDGKQWLGKKFLELLRK